jgi:hypothetical protein
MLIVEMIAKIRRAFFVQGKPIKAICRELRISRKVVSPIGGGMAEVRVIPTLAIRVGSRVRSAAVRKSASPYAGGAVLSASKIASMTGTIGPSFGRSGALDRT